jgi:phosphoribosyl-dephospho-CoA transferase
MTQDEIIRMAVKCQLLTTSNRDGLYAQALEAFAKLVAEKERESCWRMAENYDTGYEAAAAIRARGEA